MTENDFQPGPGCMVMRAHHLPGTVDVPGYPGIGLYGGPKVTRCKDGPQDPAKTAWCLVGNAYRAQNDLERAIS